MGADLGRLKFGKVASGAHSCRQLQDVALTGVKHAQKKPRE